VQDIERKDLLKFAAFLRNEKRQSPRSVYNKFENVMTFLKAQKVRDLIGKNDWPRFTEEEPEVYEQEEVNKLFAACDHEERLWYEFFLMTGMREQEVTHVYWSDINFARSTVRVSSGIYAGEAEKLIDRFGLFPGVLSQVVPRRHRARRPAEVRRLPG
jgi:integrase/recombinase XerD